MTPPTRGKAQRYEDLDWYETPRYYDAIYDVDTDLEAAFLEAAHESHATPGRGRRVLEPACGSGRLLAAMAERGWRVRGFDLGGAMVRYSRERLRSAGLAGTVVQDDMATFETPGAFDLAHCLVSTFKYLLSERDSRSHLRAVARALRPGGIYLLGLHLSRYGASRKAHERWTVERGGAEVDCTGFFRCFARARPCELPGARGGAPRRRLQAPSHQPRPEKGLGAPNGRMRAP